MTLIPCTPVSAYDWVVTARVTVVETSYPPVNVPVIIDQNAGSCAINTFLNWNTVGATIEERIANYNAAFAALTSAKLSGAPVTLYGNNAGCQIVNLAEVTTDIRLSLENTVKNLSHS